MPLRKRILKVTFHMTSGDVVMDQTLDIRVKIHKAALDPQNGATIEIFNLTKTLREQLLSQFTAFNKKAVESGRASFEGNNNPYVNVTIEAGYDNGQQNVTSVLFFGQVVQVSPSSYPPNLSVRVECFTQQINRLAWITNPPPPDVTFKEYVEWAGKQLKVDKTVCDTSIDNDKLQNQSASTHTIGDLLIDIQNAYRPNVVGYIDNNILVVRDYDKIVDVAGRATVNEFVGTPMWTTWGVEFQTLFDQNITLTCAVSLNSKMNPSLNKEFVVVSVDYDLTSRDTAFYIKVYACPPAS